MRVNAALTITALLATLAVARGMEFDLMDRYVPHSCAPARTPSLVATRDLSSTIHHDLSLIPPLLSETLTIHPVPSPVPRSYPYRGASSPEGNMKCVQEELKRQTLVMFSYETPDRTHINIRLFDPDGEPVWNNTDTHRGSSAFTTKKEGDHEACFYKTSVTDKADLKNHRVRLDWKTGVAVMDYEKIAQG